MPMFSSIFFNFFLYRLIEFSNIMMCDLGFSFFSSNFSVWALSFDVFQVSVHQHIFLYQSRQVLCNLLSQLVYFICSNISNSANIDSLISFYHLLIYGRCPSKVYLVQLGRYIFVDHIYSVSRLYRFSWYR